MATLLENLCTAWPVLHVPPGLLNCTIVYRSICNDDAYYLVLMDGPCLVDTNEKKMVKQYPNMHEYEIADPDEVREFWDKFAVAFT